MFSSTFPLGTSRETAKPRNNKQGIPLCGFRVAGKFALSGQKNLRMIILFTNSVSAPPRGYGHFDDGVPKMDPLPRVKRRSKVKRKKSI